MKTPVDWFNSGDGIRQCLDSLENFQKLLAARIEHTSGSRGSRINEQFIILGRFLLGAGEEDAVELIRPAPLDRFPTIPDVMSLNKFDEFPLMNFFRDCALSKYFIPDPVIVCAKCGTGWNMKNCHDIKFREEHVSPADLNEWIGRKFGEVKNHFLLPRGSAIRRLSPQSRGWVSNLRKWQELGRKAYSATVFPGDDYIIGPGDQLNLDVRTVFHSACLKDYFANERTRKVQRLFELAGFKEIFLPELVSKKSVPDWEVAITWHIYTSFGVLEVTEKREGNYEISGHLCGANLRALAYDPPVMTDGWVFNGGPEEIVRLLVKINIAAKDLNEKWTKLVVR